MTYRFSFARRIATSALLISCTAPALTFASASTDIPSPATTTSSAATRQQIDGPFALAMCGMAFEFGAATGRWEMAVLICEIAQIIDPMDG